MQIPKEPLVPITAPLPAAPSFTPFPATAAPRTQKEAPGCLLRPKPLQVGQDIFFLHVLRFTCLPGQKQPFLLTCVRSVFTGHGSCAGDRNRDVRNPQSTLAPCPARAPPGLVVRVLSAPAGIPHFLPSSPAAAKEGGHRESRVLSPPRYPWRALAALHAGFGRPREIKLSAGLPSVTSAILSKMPLPSP